MDKFLYHVFTHPFIVALLGACFVVSMAAYYARVRRERKPDYKRPEKIATDQ